MNFIEKTLVIIKPDGVSRGLVGEITARFEKAGLGIMMGKLFRPSKELLHRHYPAERTDWVKVLGERTQQGYDELGIDLVNEFGTTDHHTIGEKVRNWLVDYMFAGEVFAMVLVGPHAIEVVRKLVGPTVSLKAPPGTIRGDYSCDSVALANLERRPIRNLIHASGNAEEAAFEIDLRFGDWE
ncbi:MAG TPA: nucleoside-diphosphate kinase [Candidatus Absconditabacterales bacterium]|nr:nucleoside-diphosphate kinase [Candidatus Absconditabacterales bacterium]